MKKGVARIYISRIREEGRDNRNSGVVNERVIRWIEGGGRFGVRPGFGGGEGC